MDDDTWASYDGDDFFNGGQLDDYLDYLKQLSPSALFLLSRKMKRDVLNSFSEGFATYDIIERVWKQYGEYTTRQRRAINYHMAQYLCYENDFGIMDLIMNQARDSEWSNYYSPKENR